MPAARHEDHYDVITRFEVPDPIPKGLDNAGCRGAPDWIIEVLSKK